MMPWLLWVGWVLLVLLMVIVAWMQCRRNPSSVPSAPSIPTTPRVSTAPRLEAWQVALARGDGNDWARLSDRDRMALCLKAAGDLGKGEPEAWAYRDFLETFYRRPNPQTRKRPITETIAVCQVSIDNGTIRLE